MDILNVFNFNSLPSVLNNDLLRSGPLENFLIDGVGFHGRVRYIEIIINYSHRDVNLKKPGSVR
jgi:hypothetical protein